MSARTPLLIVGAGPFGLGLSRYAREHGLEHRVIGTPMAFWRKHMPDGMLLRSGIKWHLDPQDELTFRAYARDAGIGVGDLQPLRLGRYLDYVEWFQHQAGIEVDERRVTRLNQRDPANARAGFNVTLDDGETIHADRVVAAIGFHSFAHSPAELSARLPPEITEHTRDFVQFDRVEGERIAIVGGRQSAFEWAALLAEAGAAEVHLVYRHDTPEFTPSDWAWVEGLLERSEAAPGWWRQLPDAERERIGKAFWTEGRRKLEPWLEPRIDRDTIRLWPRSTIVDGRYAGDGGVALDIVSGNRTAAESVTVDRVILATGYRVDMDRVRWLGQEVRARLKLADGSPVLDERFGTSVPGLHVTSMPAARDFGPFMGFTVSVRATSRMLGGALATAAE